MRIETLDGKHCIGGNKILIETSSGSMLLDFGKNFKAWGEYFEEYLKPRTGAGIMDYWKLKLIPEFSDLYRDDLILSCFRSEVNGKRKANPVGLFLSHAHLDHSGFIGLVREDIPVVTSPISKAFLEAMETTGGKDTSSQFTEVVRRIEKEENGEKKLAASGDRVNRNYILMPLKESSVDVSSFKLTTFPVDHSIPGALALVLEVDGMQIAYTGDLRFHGKNREMTQAFFDYLSRNHVDVLITEGTRVRTLPSKEEASSVMTEQDVLDAAMTAVSLSKGKLVIADFGPRNIDRLETFIQIAKETGRRLAITDKDAYLLLLLKKTGMDLADEECLAVLVDKKVSENKWKKVVHESTEFSGRLVTMAEIQKAQGEYILSFSYWDFTNLIDMEIEGGVYIYSTSEAYSEEQIIDAKRLINWIETLNLKPFGISVDAEGTPLFSNEFHASGHASCKDLFDAIEKAKPEILVPMHTENLEVFRKYFESTGIRVIEDTTLEI